MAGFRTFATGEVLTAANVNDFLMKQSVMVFDDATARTTALGAEVVEGMLTFNKDTGALEVFDGADFVDVGGAGGGFDAVDVLTSSDATYQVPSASNPVVRVTVIGGGGGGGGGLGGDGADGGASSVEGSGLVTVTAAGGLGGRHTHGVTGTKAVNSGWVSGNGGYGGFVGNRQSGFLGITGQDGKGGSVTQAYLDTTGLSSLNVTVGAGGALGPSGEGGSGSTGGTGVVLVHYTEDS